MSLCWSSCLFFFLLDRIGHTHAHVGGAVCVVRYTHARVGGAVCVVTVTHARVGGAVCVVRYTMHVLAHTVCVRTIHTCTCWGCCLCSTIAMPCWGHCLTQYDTQCTCWGCCLCSTIHNAMLGVLSVCVQRVTHRHVWQGLWARRCSSQCADSLCTHTSHGTLHTHCTRRVSKTTSAQTRESAISSL